MGWVGVAMAGVGGVLLYSAAKGLHPWQEFLAVLKTAQLPGASPASPPAATPPGSFGEPPPSSGNPQGSLPGGAGGIVLPGQPGIPGQTKANL